MSMKTQSKKSPVKTEAKRAPPPAALAKKVVAKKSDPKTAVRQKINRVAFLLDASASMSHLQEAVKKQFALLVEGIKASTPSDQEVEISLFTFSTPDAFDMLIKNQPISTVDPGLAVQRYATVGYSTALVSSTIKAINQMANSPEGTHDDVSYLMYVITDGGDNSSSVADQSRIKAFLANLGPRWSVGVMVPGLHELNSCVRFGFQPGNIEIWDAHSVQGLEIAGNAVKMSYGGYTQARSMGATSSTNLFKADLTGLVAKDVKAKLDEFDGAIFPVRVDSVIKDFVEGVTGKTYTPGSTYYELVKYEKKIQWYKEIAIRDKNSGKTYAGAAARQLIGLDGGTHSGGVGDHGKWRVFVQSTSLNRKLPAGTSVLVKSSAL